MHGQLIILSYYHPPMSRPFTMLRWKPRAAKLMIQLLKAIKSNNPKSFGDSELWKLNRKGQRKSDDPERRAMQPENGKLRLVIERDQSCEFCQRRRLTQTFSAQNHHDIIQPTRIRRRTTHPDRATCRQWQNEIPPTQTTHSYAHLRT